MDREQEKEKGLWAKAFIGVQDITQLGFPWGVPGVGLQHIGRVAWNQAVTEKWSLIPAAGRQVWSRWSEPRRLYLDVPQRDGQQEVVVEEQYLHVEE